MNTFTCASCGRNSYSSKDTSYEDWNCIYCGHLNPKTVSAVQNAQDVKTAARQAGLDTCISGEATTGENGDFVVYPGTGAVEITNEHECGRTKCLTDTNGCKNCMTMNQCTGDINCYCEHKGKFNEAIICRLLSNPRNYSYVVCQNVEEGQSTCKIFTEYIKAKKRVTSPMFYGMQKAMNEAERKQREKRK